MAAGALPFHNTTSEDSDLGERSSFDLLLAEYKLDQHNPALVLLGDMVHGAETKAPDAIAESEGERDPDVVERVRAGVLKRDRHGALQWGHSNRAGRSEVSLLYAQLGIGEGERGGPGLPLFLACREGLAGLRRGEGQDGEVRRRRMRDRARGRAGSGADVETFRAARLLARSLRRVQHRPSPCPPTAQRSVEPAHG